MIAIYFAAEAERRDIDIDFPFLLAVTLAAQALWQYGLSSSAPLLVASQGHFLQKHDWHHSALDHDLVSGGDDSRGDVRDRGHPAGVLDDAEAGASDFAVTRNRWRWPRRRAVWSARNGTA